jgi:environmental stress-induced protein Ves
LRIIRFDELETVSWKNGGGTTREIAVEKNGETILWRLSMADVTCNGPFSNFAGLKRILTVMDGKGMRLISSHETIEASFGKPVIFDGAKEIRSELIDGPLRDLNVMFNPAHYYGTVEMMKGSMTISLEATAKITYAIIGLAGTASLDGASVLHFGNTALLKSESAVLAIAEDASVLQVMLARISEKPDQTLANRPATALR